MACIENTDAWDGAVSEISHSFTDRGVHFVAARVTSQRTGDAKDIFTQVKNLDRARVIVE